MSVEHFGLYTVVHKDAFTSQVFDADGKLIRTFGVHESAWQEANRFATDKMLKDLYA